LEHTACAAVLVRNSARFQVRRWALRLERREAAPWGGATTGDGKTPWNVRPAGFPDLGSSSRGGAMEVGSGFSLQDTVRAQVGVSPAGQGVGGPGCAGGRSMGCGNRARPSLWASGRGSGAGGGWALQTGVWGGTEHGSAVTVGRNAGPNHQRFPATSGLDDHMVVWRKRTDISSGSDESREKF